MKTLYIRSTVGHKGKIKYHIWFERKISEDDIWHCTFLTMDLTSVELALKHLEACIKILGLEEKEYSKSPILMDSTTFYKISKAPTKTLIIDYKKKKTTYK